jgi:N utilization substance protein B
VVNASNTPSSPAPRKAGHATKRSAARLAAVQALYQMEMTGVSADAVIVQFFDPEVRRQWSETSPAEFDRGMFSQIVKGVAKQRDEFDRIVGAALSADWTVDRLEIILRSILEAGTYELTERTDVPPRVTITEYVDVAHAFYSGAEPGMVNGVLDKISRKFRDTEMSAGRG